MPSAPTIFARKALGSFELRGPVLDCVASSQAGQSPGQGGVSAAFSRPKEGVSRWPAPEVSNLLSSIFCRTKDEAASGEERRWKRDERLGREICTT